MHIYDFDRQTLSDYFERKKVPKYRKEQFINWVYNRLETNFSNISTLPKKLILELKSEIKTSLPRISQIIISQDGTEKFALELEDREMIEMVLIPHKEKNTLCVSSQVGCARNCSFCATAKLGLKRNLSTSEIISQVVLAKKHITEKKLTNIVFMGMGEPLDNYDNVIRAIRILQDLFSLSPRKITISTSGVIPQIDKLVDEGLKVKLAVSLNSAIQENRIQLMPISTKYPLAELKKSLLRFNKKNPFRITFEYIMIREVNMGDEDVKAIKSYIGDISCKLNLIKWNTITDMSYNSPTEDEIRKFQKKLMTMESAVTYRKSRGSDVPLLAGNWLEHKKISGRKYNFV